jgi:hypothetical protein
VNVIYEKNQKSNNAASKRANSIVYMTLIALHSKLKSPRHASDFISLETMEKISRFV